MLESHNPDLQRCGIEHGPGDLSDSALVSRFVSGDGVAFEILVRRHGPMVLGVCRRQLRHEQDAEDAFQAAFMVLHRKAHSIRATTRLANWLYGVANRTAMKAKSARHTMRTREMQVDSLPEPMSATPKDAWQDVEPLLDQELSRLPEKVRLPILLCELEGMSLKEAARQLGLPEGTLAARLSRGRSQLRDRLSRHGIQLSVAALVGMLANHSAAQVLGVGVIETTIQGAAVLASGQAGIAAACSANVAALTKGVLKSMFITKLKFAAATAAVSVMLGTSVLTAVRASDDQPTAAAPAANSAQLAQAPAVAVEAEAGQTNVVTEFPDDVLVEAPAGAIVAANPITLKFTPGAGGEETGTLVLQGANGTIFNLTAVNATGTRTTVEESSSDEEEVVATGTLNFTTGTTIELNTVSVVGTGTVTVESVKNFRALEAEVATKAQAAANTTAGEEEAQAIASEQDDE